MHKLRSLLYSLSKQCPTKELSGVLVEAAGKNDIGQLLKEFSVYMLDICMKVVVLIAV